MVVFVAVRNSNVGPHMILCMYGSCAAGCNQEPVCVVVWRKLFRDIVGMTMLQRNYGKPSGSLVGGA